MISPTSVNEGVVEIPRLYLHLWNNIEGFMANLSETLNKIGQLFDQWQSLQPIAREDEDRLWKKFRLEWNFNSNHIEGNTLTYKETELLFIFDKTTGDHEMREFEEMKAHDVAIKAIQEWSEDKNRELTESDIRTLNKIILVRPYWKEALTYDGQPTRREIKVGEYKEHPNSVRLSNGEMFHYSKPEEVGAKMNELMDWYRENQTLPPVILAAEMHYRFILIHPFDDGNGRIARLLVNYILMKNDFPPIIIKSADKNNYLTALNKADVGDREAFHEYIAEQLIWSLNISINAAKGESIEEDDDIDKEISILKKQKVENKAEQKRSREVIQRTYLHSLKSIYSELNNKLSKFDDLFIKKDIECKVENPLKSTRVSEEGISLEYVDKQILFDYNNPKVYGQIVGVVYSAGVPQKILTYPEIYRVIITYLWKGYKNSGINAFDVSCSIQTKFDEYKYTLFIFGNEEISISKIYGHDINEVESTEFIKKASQYVLNEIKSKNNEIKS